MATGHVSVPALTQQTGHSPFLPKMIANSKKRGKGSTSEPPPTFLPHVQNVLLKPENLPRNERPVGVTGRLSGPRREDGAHLGVRAGVGAGPHAPPPACSRVTRAIKTNV